ncbi:MAG: flippase-like domain-containing protein [Proteobacteria bacterium]|nr:MAG: flippase-like domain-containing protein [Pseudomonadota bacterium]
MPSRALTCARRPVDPNALPSRRTRRNFRTRRRKNTIGLVLKIGFVVAVFWFLSKKNLISIEAFREGLNHPAQLALGGAALLLSLLLGAVRFMILIRNMNYKLSNAMLFQIHLIGTFFNVALPGAVSGDLVKSYYLKRNSAASGMSALGVLVIERMIGTAAMLFVSALALHSPYFNFTSTKMELMRVILTWLSVGAIAFFAYLIFVPNDRDPIIGWLEKGSARFSKLLMIKNLFLGMKSLQAARSALFIALFISFLIQSIIGFACFQFAQALGETQLSQLAFYGVVPTGLLVTALPVLPGGVGTGHAAFSFLFHELGSDRGADLFSFYAIFQIGFSALCGLVYLRFKSEHPELVAQMSQDESNREAASTVPNSSS